MQIIRRIIFVVLSTGLLAQAQQSFTMEQAITYAQEHSYLAQNAGLEVERASHLVSKTLAIGFPQISIGGNYNYYIKQPVQVVPAEFFGGQPGELAEFVFGVPHNINTNITATQLIFDGSYIIGIKGSEKYKELSVNAEKKTKTEIRDIVVQLYGAVLVARENKKVLEETLKNLDRLVTENQVLADNGFLDQTDVEQIAILAANTENQLRFMERFILQSLGALKLSMGIEMAKEITLSDKLDDLVSWATIVGIMDQSFDYNRHIDYILANNDREMKALQVQLEKAKYLPRLDAFINYQQNAFSLDFGDYRWFPASLVGLSFSMPIFTSFATRNSVQESLIELDKSSVSRKQTEQQLILDAENAKTDYLLAYNLYNTNKRSWELAKNINIREFRKYEEGLSSSLNILQTQNQYLEAQNLFAESIFELVKAKSQLEKALNTVK